MKKYLFHSFWFHELFFLIYFFSLELITRIMIGFSIFSLSNIEIFFGTIFLSFFCSFFLSFFEQKIRKILSIIFLIVIFLYYFLELGLYHYLGFFMGFHNSSQGMKVVSFFSDFIHSLGLFHLLLVFLCILFIISYLFLSKKVMDSSITWIKRVIIFFGVIIIYYVSIRFSFFQDSLQTRTNYSLWLNPDNANLVVSNYGVAMYGIFDFKSIFISPKKEDYPIQKRNIVETENMMVTDSMWEKLNQSTENSDYLYLNQFFQNRSVSTSNEMTGIFKDNNLIIVLMESVNEIGIINEKDFPTLYKLYHEGISFHNHYSPRSNCSTGNSEFSVLTSLYPVNGSCNANQYGTMYRYPESLYEVFKKNGYTTSAFHNYYDRYYDRTIIHNQLGVDHYYGADELGISYTTEYGEWPNDMELFQKAKDYYMHDDKFVAYFATISTHHPYINSTILGDQYMSLWDNTSYSDSLKRYLSKMKVLDEALYELLNELEEEKKLDDTVIVLFGDHYPYGLTDKDINMYLKLNGADYYVNRDSIIQKNIDRVPMVIYHNNMDAISVSKYTTPVILVPTIFNLFGLAYDSRLYFGEDVFSKNYTNIAYFGDGSWQNNRGYYSNMNHHMNYIDKNYKYTKDQLLKINQMSEELLDGNSKAIQSGYFEYFYSNIDLFE